jgi:hypothetical protein
MKVAPIAAEQLAGDTLSGADKVALPPSAAPNSLATREKRAEAD